MTLNSMRRSSSSVTMRLPNAIEPSDRVDARTNAFQLGCLGILPSYAGP